MTRNGACWGFDDRALYEKLVPDGFQAGLSWISILRVRGSYRPPINKDAPEAGAAVMAGEKRVSTIGLTAKGRGIPIRRVKPDWARFKWPVINNFVQEPVADRAPQAAPALIF